MAYDKRFCRIIPISLLEEVVAKVDREERVQFCHLDSQKALIAIIHGLLDQKAKAFFASAKVNNWVVQSLKGTSSRMRIGVSMRHRAAIQPAASLVCLSVIGLPDSFQRHGQYLGRRISHFANDTQLLTAANCAVIQRNVEKIY